MIAAPRHETQQWTVRLQNNGDNFSNGDDDFNENGNENYNNSSRNGCDASASSMNNIRNTTTSNNPELVRQSAAIALLAL